MEGMKNGLFSSFIFLWRKMEVKKEHTHTYAYNQARRYIILASYLLYKLIKLSFCVG